MQIDSVEMLFVALAGVLSAIGLWIRSISASNAKFQAQSETTQRVLQEKMESDLKAKDASLVKLQAEMHDQATDILAIKLKIASIEGEKKALAETNALIMQQLQDAARENGQLKQQLAALEVEKQRLEAERSSLISQGIERDKDRQRIETELAEAKASIETLNQQVQKSTALIITLQDKLDALTVKPESPLAVINADSHQNGGENAVNSMGE